MKEIWEIYITPAVAGILSAFTSFLLSGYTITNEDDWVVGFIVRVGAEACFLVFIPLFSIWYSSRISYSVSSVIVYSLYNAVISVLCARILFSDDSIGDMIKMFSLIFIVTLISGLINYKRKNKKSS